MLRGSLTGLLVLVALAGCPGGNGGIGDPCGGHDDCDGTLQCLNSRCVARCERAPECGDGYACDVHGICQQATGTHGDLCASEVDCGAGLSCQISDKVDADNHLVQATCTPVNDARPAGAACDEDSSCRNGTCALGHCVDLCHQTRDCGAGTSCVTIPHLLVTGATFDGCLQSQGAVTWSISMLSPSGEILLPVPDVARSAELVMSVDDPGQKVGALSVLAQNDGGGTLYTMPCSPQIPSDPPCDASAALDYYFAQPIRHVPDFGQSVLLIPSGPAAAIGPQVYRVQVSSFRGNDTPGFAIPRVTAVVQLDTAVTLDLHLFFLDLEDHPCAEMMNNATLDANAARNARFFQDTYLADLRTTFARAGLTVGAITYENIPNHPELDGLDVSDAGELLSLGRYATGINVFFVRSLSPVGLQAFGPNPGPAGLGGTRQSGIVIGLDTLCYRDWRSLARLTAHEIARYMGLYHNVELEVDQHPRWRDLLDDDDDNANDNLLFYSELGGVSLSHSQGDILGRSAVLR